MICDFVESYHILNYRELTPTMVSILCYGLRDNSRVKMKLANTSQELDTLLMASLIDKVSFIAWTQTADAQNGVNRPKSLLDALMNGTDDDSDLMKYETAEDFEEARRKILEN